MKLAPLALAALAAVPATAQVQAYLVDSNLDVLYSVNLTTGAATRIASTANNGLTVPADLTWRADTQELYTIDLSGGEVGTINTTTGTFTPRWQTNLSGWQGITWDPTTSLFYLQSQTSNNIYSLNPTSGAVTLLGPGGGSLLTTLEVDAAGNVWSVEFFGAGRIAQVNKTTGALTYGPAASVGLQGLSIGPGGQWFGVNTNDDSLYRINPTTGATTLVGAHGGGVVFAKGFEIAGDAPGFQDIPMTGCPNGGFVGRSSSNPRPGGSITLTCSPAGGMPFLLYGVRGPFPLPQPIACQSGCVVALNPIDAISAAQPITLPIPSIVQTGAQISFQCVTITSAACAELSAGVQFTVQ